MTSVYFNKSQSFLNLNYVAFNHQFQQVVFRTTISHSSQRLKLNQEVKFCCISSIPFECHIKNPVLQQNWNYLQPGTIISSNKAN